jgi:hypothetical protein
MYSIINCFLNRTSNRWRIIRDNIQYSFYSLRKYIQTNSTDTMLNFLFKFHINLLLNTFSRH